MTDAEATVRSALLDGLSRSAHITRLVAGPAAERLLEDLLNALSERYIRQALRDYVEELDDKEAPTQQG